MIDDEVAAQAREELAATIIDFKFPEQNALTKPEDALTMVRTDPDFFVCWDALELADAIIAAGWRPPTVMVGNQNRSGVADVI